MEKLKQYKYIIILTLVILGFAFYWYLYRPEQIKKDLPVRMEQYSNMIEMKLCQEAYDEFITSGSKERKGRNFFYHCEYRAEDWENIIIEKILFTDGERADVKIKYDLLSADLDSKEYLNCTRNPYMVIVSDCMDIDTRKITNKETIETWFLEDGKWKRDY